MFYRFARMQAADGQPGGVRLYVQGPIEPPDPWWTPEGATNYSNVFRKELDKHAGETLTVVIDSPGGSADAGIAMCEMLRQREGETWAEVYNASSAATLVLAGCDKGRRLLSPGALLMYHNPAVIAAGDHRDMEKAREYLNKLKEAVISLYEESSGLSREELSAIMEAETFFTATEAISKGFADGLLERKGDGQMATMRGMTPHEIAAASMQATEAIMRRVIETESIPGATSGEVSLLPERPGLSDRPGPSEATLTNHAPEGARERTESLRPLDDTNERARIALWASAKLLEKG